MTSSDNTVTKEHLNELFIKKYGKQIPDIENCELHDGNHQTISEYISLYELRAEIVEQEALKQGKDPIKEATYFRDFVSKLKTADPDNTALFSLTVPFKGILMFIDTKRDELICDIGNLVDQ